MVITENQVYRLGILGVTPAVLLVVKILLALFPQQALDVLRFVSSLTLSGNL